MHVCLCWYAVAPTYKKCLLGLPLMMAKYPLPVDHTVDLTDMSIVPGPYSLASLGLHVSVANALHSGL